MSEGEKEYNASTFLPTIPRMPNMNYTVEIGTESRPVQVSDGTLLFPDGTAFPLEHLHEGESIWELEARLPDSEKRVPVTVEMIEDERTFRIAIMGESIDLVLRDRHDQRGEVLLGATSSGRPRGTVLRAPMPGLLKEVLVTSGHAVSKGDPLCILEAMKMENELRSPGDFTVGRIFVEEGAPVEKGVTMLELKPVEESA